MNPTPKNIADFDKRLAALESQMAVIETQLQDIRTVITDGFEYFYAANRSRRVSNKVAMRWLEDVQDRLNPVFDHVFPQYRAYLDELNRVFRPRRSSDGSA